MEIVASNNMLRKFRTIKEFKLDMGTSKTSETQKEGNRGPGQVIIKIKDPFIKRYQIKTNNYIVKSGNIGSLSFYTDNTMGYDEFKIYDKDNEYTFRYNEFGDIRNYLSSTLDKILDEEINPVKLDMNMEEKIEFELDKNLPQNEFVNKRKELEENMNKMGIRMPRN